MSYRRQAIDVNARTLMQMKDQTSIKIGFLIKMYKMQGPTVEIPESAKLNDALENIFGLTPEGTTGEKFQKAKGKMEKLEQRLNPEAYQAVILTPEQQVNIETVNNKLNEEKGKKKKAVKKLKKMEKQEALTTTGLDVLKKLEQDTNDQLKRLKSNDLSAIPFVQKPDLSWKATLEKA